jgi:glyoxylase-like metal-dependent hydrolase (beta-lactamase superfamily II)
MPVLLRPVVSSLLVVCLLPALAAAEDHFMVTTLAPDLLMLSTDQGSYSNNSLVFTGEEGVLLVDTHHDSDAEAFRDFVEKLGFGIPKYIINTHRHVEHIGGNAVFGPDPIIVAHHLMPEKLLSGTFLFSEYPRESFPDITFKDSVEIRFNGEIIRLTYIGGSHDDNEIMVHFTKHGIAHISSVVNGFNFPSVDSDGDVLEFESVTRRLMTLLPKNTRLISGHNGKSKGFDFVGTWDMLPAYADTIKATVEIVRSGLEQGMTMEEMQKAGVLDEYEEYAGSYVGTDRWIEYIVDALTEPREIRADVCKPVYEEWKKNGAEAAVDLYRELLRTQEQEYDFNEYVLMSIGSKLYTRGLYDDSIEFLLGSVDIYPNAKYGYYTHYLAAKNFQRLSRPDLAAKHCRESLRLKPDFEEASRLMEELSRETSD